MALNMDITPSVAEGVQLVQSYGEGRFRVAGEVHEGSVILFSGERHAWPVTAAAEASADNLRPVLDASDTTDILVLGCGPTFLPPPKDLRAALKEYGIVLEWMDTGAACRTFNVLLTEGRRVAAALIAID